MKTFLKKIYIWLVTANVNRQGMGYIASNGRGRASMKLRVYRAKTKTWEDPVEVKGGFFNKVKSLVLK